MLNGDIEVNSKIIKVQISLLEIIIYFGTEGLLVTYVPLSLIYVEKLNSVLQTELFSKSRGGEGGQNYTVRCNPFIASQ